MQQISVALRHIARRAGDAKTKLSTWQKQNFIVKKVGILIRDCSARRHAAIHGIMECVRKKPGCRLFLLDHHRTAREILDIGGWGLDGLIVSLEGASLEVFDAVVALNLPVVNIGTAPVDFPSVSVSAKSVAKLVADHLEHRSVTSFAFISTAHHQRLANTLAQEATNRNWEFQHLETEFCDSTLLDPPLRNRFERSIASMRGANKHLAIVTSCDFIAIGVSQMLLQSVDDFGVSALISCRESFLCGMPDDSITAVQEPSYQLGLEAARIMGSLLNGRTPPRHSTIDATELIVRKSTANPADDPLIVHVVAFIRENAANGIKVSDLLRLIDVSRVTFERRFRDAIGRSPGEEIRRLRLEGCKERLRDDRRSITHISKLCGFDSLNKFSTFFRKGTGQTPSEFRKKLQVSVE